MHLQATAHLGHLQEESKGNRWTGGEVMRDATREERMEFVFVCEVCGKVCKSKGGLTIHRKRMHEVSKMKKSFQCERCKEVFGQEANLRNHEKACSGVAGVVSNKRKCDILWEGDRKKELPGEPSELLICRSML